MRTIVYTSVPNGIDGMQLKKVVWVEGLELAKLARRERQDFDCATWLHKARELSKEDFQQAIERELTGKIAEQTFWRGEPGHRDPETLLFSMTQFFKLLPENQKQAFLRQPNKMVMGGYPPAKG